MAETSQAAMKLRRGSPISDGKTGVSCARTIEFAAPPVSKRHKTNFTHKDSLPQQAFLFDLPLKGGGRERSERGGGPRRRRLRKPRGRGPPPNLPLSGGGISLSKPEQLRDFHVFEIIQP